MIIFLSVRHLSWLLTPYVKGRFILPSATWLSGDRTAEVLPLLRPGQEWGERGVTPSHPGWVKLVTFRSLASLTISDQPGWVCRGGVRGRGGIAGQTHAPPDNPLRPVARWPAHWEDISSPPTSTFFTHRDRYSKSHPTCIFKHGLHNVICVVRDPA